MPQLRLSRRRLLQSAAGVSVAAVGVAGYAWRLEAWWFEVVQQELELPGLPEAFAGFTIAQISDLHFGRLVSPDDLKPALESVMSLRADAIVVTGDLVTHVGHGEPDMIVQALSHLSAPEGVFAILGNHDWWWGGTLVAESLQWAGVIVLQNEHVGWQRGGQSLYLSGLGDVCVGRHDLSEALAGLPSSAKVVLLVHEPDFADHASLDARILLQLSGHSHGGQICVPGYGGLHFPRFARKYTSGLYSVGSLSLYTNRGLGMIGLPLRFCCRPEITLFTLWPAMN